MLGVGAIAKFEARLVLLDGQFAVIYLIDRYLPISSQLSVDAEWLPL